MKDWIEHCLNKEISKLPNEVINIHGMTSNKIRHFLNNLLELPRARYLEVGIWKGATFTSALYGNNLDYAYAVDNWSAGGKREFLNNTNGMDYVLFEGDAFDAQPERINIYMYDASKLENNIYRALEYYYPFLDDEFIYMVDDFNCPNAQTGTDRAIKDLGLEVLYFNHLGKQEWNERVPNEWWIGFLVSVLKK